jgi:hypothetical protein
VIAGRDRWGRRLEGIGNDLRLRLAEVGEGDETLTRTFEDLSGHRQSLARPGASDPLSALEQILYGSG